MDPSLVPFVQLRPAWFSHHAWDPGVRPQALPTTLCKFWLMLRGTAEVTAGDRLWQVESGQAFLVTPAHRRSLVVTHEPVELVGMGFTVTFLEHIDLLQGLERPALWRPSAAEFAIYRQSLLELSQLETPSDLAGQILRASLSQTVFALCWRHLEQSGLVKVPEERESAWLAGVLAHVRRRPSMTIAEWARAVGFSPAQFRRLFQQAMGLSPQQYLTQLRLREARRLLGDSEMSVQQLARHLGFGSQEHFIRIFRRETGQTPGKFRSSPRRNEIEI